MAEQAVIKPSVRYVSGNSESDFQRFKGTQRRVVQVPKECVEQAITDEQQRRKMKEAKHG